MKSIILIIFVVLCSAHSNAEKKWVFKGVPEKSYGIAGLRCIDPTHCYAFISTLDFNSIYKSTDKGNSWFKFSEFNRTKPKFDTLRTIYKCLVYDSLQLYMNFIEGAALEKSTDGGKSFKRVYFEELYDLKSVERLYEITMFTKDIGVSVTRTTLLYTFDNWETYTAITKPDSIRGAGNPIFFLDSNNIVTLKLATFSDEFMIYNIPNNEWSQYSFGEDIPDGQENKCMVDLSFVNHNLIYACGFQHTGVAHYSKDLIWKSTDRGRTWVKLLDKLNPPGIGLDRIAFRDEKHGIALGSWGKVLETTDGGKSWFQYPIKKEMVSVSSEIAWAGEYAIYVADNTGFFRLETVTEVKELSSNKKFRVFKSGNNLEIAIKDANYSIYTLQIYNNSGQKLMTNSVPSAFGFIFEPIELIDLTNGVYYYTISFNGSVEYTGKLAIIE